MKLNGDWDLRPHPARVITVTPEILDEWRALSGDQDEQLDSIRLLNPISVQEQKAIVALGAYPHRLGEFGPRISSGYHESGAKKDG